MVKALFDTNILIDYLNGVPQARDEIQLYHDKAISIISWMEVMVGADTRFEQASRAFLGRFQLIELNDRIAACAVVLRRERRIKLPDAIIEASAQVNGMLLVTRNTKDFDAGSPAVRIPYVL